MSSRDEEVSQVPDQLIAQLLKGYDSLLLEFKTLNDQRRELDHKLAWAKQQYSDVLKRYCPEKASIEGKAFQDELEEAGACERNGQIDWLECLSDDQDAGRRSRAFIIRVANDAREKLRHRQSDLDGVRIWKSPEKRGSISSKLRSELERDYTTPGTPSRLSCPFAIALGENNPRRPSTLGDRNLPTPRSSASRTSGSFAKRGRRPSLPLSVDPIQAEICGIDTGSPAISGQGSSAVCPIRFLDQHSAEEVAQYFEKHKHEIPRSHEVCIKRYQSNSAQIKQLDAKYGNLVSMIQGLGEKHQPWLPEKVEGEDDEQPNEEAVTKWAENVSNGIEEAKAEDQTTAEDEDRTSHFDRMLKEVRVGESPSRPWGITVPSKYQRTASVSSQASGHTASPQELSAPKLPMNADQDMTGRKMGGAKCPFDRSKLSKPDMGAIPNPSPHPEVTQDPPPSLGRPTLLPSPGDHEAKSTPADLPKPSPQMVFTGPVFIGYSTDQALQVLRDCNFTAK